MDRITVQIAGRAIAITGVLAFLGGLGYIGLNALQGAWDLSGDALRGETYGLAAVAAGLLMVCLGQWLFRSRGTKILLHVSIVGYTVALAVWSLSWLRVNRLWVADEAIVDAVRKGTLKSDKRGDIRLPPPWAWATRNGHVYVMQGKGLTLLFPTAVDRLKIELTDGNSSEWQIAGYVYSAEGMPKEQGFEFIKPDCDSVNAYDEALPPHWYFAEPFYS